jgi:hypothetical protein
MLGPTPPCVNRAKGVIGRAIRVAGSIEARSRTPAGADAQGGLSSLGNLVDKSIEFVADSASRLLATGRIETVVVDEG